MAQFPEPPRHQLEDLETHLRLRALETGTEPEEITLAENKEQAWQTYTIKIWHTLKRAGVV